MEEGKTKTRPTSSELAASSAPPADVPELNTHRHINSCDIIHLQ